VNCCGFTSNGVESVSPGSGGAGFDVLDPGTIITTDGSTQTLVVANLAAVGARVFYYSTIVAQQTNGDRAMRANYWTDASRNAAGSGILTSGNIGPNGYTDVPPSLPWTTVVVPAGWGIVEANLVGDQVQILFGAAAGQTVEWRIVVQRLLLGGATP